MKKLSVAEVFRRVDVDGSGWVRTSTMRLEKDLIIIAPDLGDIFD